jgi:hypothetical protein
MCWSLYQEAHKGPPDVQMVSSLFTHPTSLHFFLFTGSAWPVPVPACLQSSVRLPNRFIAFCDPPPSILLVGKVLTPHTEPSYLLYQFIPVIPLRSVKQEADEKLELYRPRDRRLSAKWLPNFADRGCNVVSVTDPYDRVLGFLDRSRYFSIK